MGWGGGFLPIIKSLPTHVEVEFGCDNTTEDSGTTHICIAFAFAYPQERNGGVVSSLPNYGPAVANTRCLLEEHCQTYKVADHQYQTSK